MIIVINVPDADHGMEIIESIARHGGVPILVLANGEPVVRPVTVESVSLPAITEAGQTGELKMTFTSESEAAQSMRVRLLAHSEDLPAEVLQGLDLLGLVRDLVNNWTFETEGGSLSIRIEPWSRT